MGDSYTATAPLIGQSDDGCMHSANSWPNQLAALGIPDRSEMLDTSCNGGTIDTGDGWTLLHQARKAADRNAFGPATRAVLIQLGMNDTWGGSAGRAFPSVDCLLDVVRGCGLDAADQNRLPDYRAVTGDAYAARIREVVDYVRYYAPAATVAIVGYPEIFAPDQPAACMDLAVGGRVVQPRAEGYLAYLDRLQDAQRDAAQQLGIRFFDVRSVTAGHGSCTAAPWISGLTGDDSPFAGAPVHPNAAGNTAVATGVERWLGL
ncbi:SGNH/GDSL hydrolase family protein [Nocardia aurantia]|nr:SGNH/GDSL hydrolase family protein [Nocardia aurantia]